MKLIELLLAQPVMAELATMKMNAKTAYAIAKNMRRMEAELAALQAGREAIIKRLSGEDGQIPSERMEEANKEYSELVQQEVEMQPYLIPLEALGELELTPGQMMALGWMIDSQE
jgi:hypothetical protein